MMRLFVVLSSSCFREYFIGMVNARAYFSSMVCDKMSLRRVRSGFLASAVHSALFKNFLLQM